MSSIKRRRGSAFFAIVDSLGERFTTIGKYSQSIRLLTAADMEPLTVKPSRGKLLLKVFGGSALLLAILFALGEIGTQFGH